MRKGNGGIVCRKCLGPGEYAFSRERGRRYTAETGPVVEMMLLTVYRCPVDGLYSTIFPDDIIRNKQYCLSDIRCVLEGKADFSLASPRTRAYWRAWFKGMWEAVVTRIQLSIGCTFPKKDISTELLAFCKEVGDGWLRYVLDLFYTESNNLACSSTWLPLPSSSGAKSCTTPMYMGMRISCRRGASRPREGESDGIEGLETE